MFTKQQGVILIWYWTSQEEYCGFFLFSLVLMLKWARSPNETSLALNLQDAYSGKDSSSVQGMLMG